MEKLSFFYKKYFYSVIVLSFIGVIIFKVILDHAVFFTQHIKKPILAYNLLFILYIIIFLLAYWSFGWYFIRTKKSLIGYIIFALGFLLCLKSFEFFAPTSYYSIGLFSLGTEIVFGLKVLLAINVIHANYHKWLNLYAIAVLIDLLVSVLAVISNYDFRLLYEVTEVLPYFCLVIFFSKEGDVIPSKLKAFLNGERIS